MISERFGTLAQSFRVFAEQQFRFHRLLLVDAPEAVGNLDHAIDGILNAFHGLFDDAKNEAKEAFNFYDDPLCAFVLRLRNARHHNQANGLRNIYRRARYQDPPINYLLVDFAASEDGGATVNTTSLGLTCSPFMLSKLKNMLNPSRGAVKRFTPMNLKLGARTGDMATRKYSLT